METIKAKVCILGAGSAGMGAAYALRDLKGELVIVEKYNDLGGTAINAWVETWIHGINLPYILEMFEVLIKSGHTSAESVRNSWLGKIFNKNNLSSEYIYIPKEILKKKYSDDMLAAGVKILNNHIFKSAVFDIIDGTKKKVTAIQIEGETGKKVIEADYFIDCSGSGILCRTVNGIEEIDYLYGEDSRSDFGESLAPEVPDKNNMNEPSLFYKVGNGIAEKKEVMEWAEQPISCRVTADGYIDDYEGNKSPNWLNPMSGFGGTGKEALDNEEGMYKEFSEVTQYQHWALVKNLLNKHKHENNYLGYCPKRQINYIHQGLCAPMLGIRESYRIRCKKMLSQRDLTILVNSKDLKDYIACGSHPVDMHINGNISRDAIKRFNNQDLKPSGIPFGCIRPVGLTNVLIACKAFGASHIALASRRTNKDMAQLGWAAGHATVLCIKNNFVDYGKIEDTIGMIGELQRLINLKESVQMMESLMK